MEEIRIDCAHPTQEEMELSQFHAQTLFRLNQTMPFTEEYDSLISQLFPEMGENNQTIMTLTIAGSSPANLSEYAVGHGLEPERQSSLELQSVKMR